eukprot:m.86167 g.86167  ORF g.86167 m.86167 type:complete len:894 (-) comp12799_c0_seq3:3845-6526(-)
MTDFSATYIMPLSADPTHGHAQMTSTGDVALTFEEFLSQSGEREMFPSSPSQLPAPFKPLSELTTLSGSEATRDEHLRCAKTLIFQAASQSDLTRQQIGAVLLPSLHSLIANKDTSVRLEITDNIVPVACALAAFDNKETTQHLGLDDSSSLQQHIISQLSVLVQDASSDVRARARTQLETLMHKHPDNLNVPRPAIINLAMEIVTLLNQSVTYGDDMKSECLLLISNIILEIPHSTVIETILPIVTSLSKDSTFRVRKCAPLCLSSVCRAVPRSLICKQLTKTYLSLCKDPIWGVRKACAEAISVLANAQSRQDRQHLTKVACDFAHDDSRWVRSAIYANLGPLIASFVPSPPGVDGVDCDLTELDAKYLELEAIKASLEVEQGAQSTSAQDEQERSQYDNFLSFDIEIVHVEDRNGDDEQDSKPDPAQTAATAATTTEDDTSSAPSSDLSTTALQQAVTQQSSEDKASTTTAEPVADSFASNLFWQAPMSNTTDDEFDLLLKEMGMAAEADTTPAQPSTLQDQQLPTATDSKEVSASTDAEDARLKGLESPAQSDTARLAEPQPDDMHGTRYVVPKQLIDLYHSMHLEVTQRTVDSNVVRLCAFSAPAVVWALGREYWHLIAETYKGLATCSDWYVRACIANSVHQVARILGSAIAEKDLLPLFLDFLNDWVDVQAHALKNFASFFTVCSATARSELIQPLCDMRESIEPTMWRQHDSLLAQIPRVVQLLDCKEVLTSIIPLISPSLEDSFSVVRAQAANASAHVLARIIQENLIEDGAGSAFLSTILAHRESHKYNQRLVFLMIVFKLLALISLESVPQQLLQAVSLLVDDKVVNVRLRLAADLVAYVQGSAEPEAILSAAGIPDMLTRLQRDADLDVCTVALDARASSA